MDSQSQKDLLETEEELVTKMEFSNEKWFKMPESMKVTQVADEPVEISISHNDVRNHVGQYSTNNGILCANNENGEQFIGSNTKENRDELERAGYKSSMFMVPFSNGERPTETTLNMNLERILTNGEFVNRKDSDEQLRIKLMQQAKKSGILDKEKFNFSNDKWFKMPESLQTIREGEKPEEIIPSRFEKLKYVGSYATNNGLIAVYDENGDKFIGSDTNENREALKKSGYQLEAFTVPFSSGEMPTDMDLAKKIDTIITNGRNQTIKERDEKARIKIMEGAKKRGLNVIDK